ncbi:MAG: hypothetical protein HYT70_03600 [Candidatus Aenigmarchaeota archaeon]|nr:hypothetical protein [Candidatus Aenigmarchaeota archaeon]
MKGISPIVASVLLIAITMTIAGVLAYWSSTFVEKSLPVENRTTADCRVAQFEFLSCRLNSTGGTLLFSLNNIRSASLNITAYVEYSNGTISENPLNTTLVGNSIRSYTVTGVSSDFSRLLIKTNCPELSRASVCGG